MTGSPTPPRNWFSNTKLRTIWRENMDRPALLSGLTERQQNQLALPAMLAILAILAALTLYGMTSADGLDADKLTLNTVGFAGGIYVFLLFYIILPNASKLKTLTRWLLAISSAILLGLLTGLQVGESVGIFYLFIILTVVITSITIGRGPTYLILGIYCLLLVANTVTRNSSILDWLKTFSPPAVAFVIDETVLRLLDIMQRRVQQMEIINQFARQIASSLETEPVLSLLNAAIQNALEADTYYVGLLEGDFVKLDLFYDDGEYFSAIKVPLKGSLSGWVLKHRQSLFLPDLREDLGLEGIEVVTVGKDKDSLSWVGVPMQAAHTRGIIALASYRPNAFDHSTLELLENLAQLAAMALDNSYQHAEVERQSRLDSLTQIYNHGYFIKALQELAQEAEVMNTCLSLIMLDIDFFKSYNDSFGHLFGDKVLETLSQTIRNFVKNTDVVGRWGGEEFAIVLPTADGAQALMVAERIRETMNNTVLEGPEHRKVPVPTVSQGIALFPQEARGIYELIDLADKRLYVAKERGRNQIEPGAQHWHELASLLDEAT